MGMTDELTPGEKAMTRINEEAARFADEQRRQGAEWAIQQLRDASASALQALKSTQEQDYKKIEQTLRVAADEIALKLAKGGVPELGAREG
jgi:hypothetical protein